MAFTFDAIFAADPNNPANVAANAAITIFDPNDPGKAPITITDPTGSPIANPLTVNKNGFGSAFQHATLDRVGWSGGGFEGFFTSYEGMKNVATAARTAAETAAATAGADAAAVADAAIGDATAEAEAAAASAAAAEAAAASSATAAANSAALVGAPADTAIAAAINGTGTATKTALNATYATKAELAALPVGGGANLLTNAYDSTLYAAHRVGGNLVYPEQAEEGIAATFAAGFAAEVDIQPLADGTLVLCHDTTTDRTMDITGTVASKTVQQWKDARLKPILPGGKKHLAPFWEDVLNVYGGRGIFFAEIKTNDNVAAQNVIDSITSRGLQGSVTILTFNSTHAMMAADAGLTVTYISNDVAPATAATWGITGLSCSQTGTQAYVESITAAGLIPGVYGINTLAEAQTRIGWGAKTITTDDPWFLTGRYSGVNRDPFAKMDSWVGQKNTNPAEFKFLPKTDGSVALYMKGNPGIRAPFPGGPIVKPSRILGTWKLGTLGPSAASIRMYFGTTKDQHGTNQEGATDNYYMVMIRRSGELACYRKSGGVSTQLTGTGATNPVFPVLATDAAGADMQVQIDILTTGIEVTNLSAGTKMVYADTTLAGPFYTSLSLGGGSPQPDGEFRNLSKQDL